MQQGSTDVGKKETDNADLAGNTFYVNPLLVVERDELRDAVEHRKSAEASATGFSEISFHVVLVDEELKQAAAAAVNSTYPNAHITAGNIAVIPYKFVEIAATDIDGNKIVLASFPDRSFDRAFGTSDRPNVLTVSVRGPVSFLKHVTSAQGRLTANLLISEFSLKQNVVDATLHNIVQLGYYRFLTGQADIGLLRTSTSEFQANEFQIGAVQFGGIPAEGSESGKNRSWVTRNQLRAVLAACLRKIDLSDWKELRSNPDAQRRVIDLLEKEVTHRSDTVEASIEKTGNEWHIRNARVEEDLGPTRLAKLDLGVKATVTLEESLPIHWSA